MGADRPFPPASTRSREHIEHVERAQRRAHLRSSARTLLVTYLLEIRHVLAEDAGSAAMEGCDDAMRSSRRSAATGARETLARLDELGPPSELLERAPAEARRGARTSTGRCSAGSTTARWSPSRFTRRRGSTRPRTR